MTSPLPKQKRPTLLSKLEGHSDIINQALLVPGEDAVISVSDDKSMRVWVKRDSGQYWPTICQVYQAATSALAYDHKSHRLFVGLGNGVIHEYTLSEDLNRLNHKRQYTAHSGRVMAVKFLETHNWLISVGRDKTLQFYSTKTGRKLGSYDAQAWCMDVEFDPISKYAFVADYSGQVSVLKLETTGFEFLTSLRGHQSSVKCLCYDTERRLLFSGGFDQIVVVWDIGSQNGTAYELTGHNGKLCSLLYSSHTRKLISSDDEGKIGVWDMTMDRQETAEWAAGSACEKCHIPFFWNVKEMWTQKTVGVRQHHCRRCGRALCGHCTDRESTFPPMGFEIPVRMCSDCHKDITTNDRTPRANFTAYQHTITNMSMDQPRGIWLTVGVNKTISLWDMRPMLS